MDYLRGLIGVETDTQRQQREQLQRNRERGAALLQAAQLRRLNKVVNRTRNRVQKNMNAEKQRKAAEEQKKSLLSEQLIEGVTFKDIQLELKDIIGKDFKNCTFTNVTITNESSIQFKMGNEIAFVDCSFDTVDFSQCLRMDAVMFQGCTLTKTTFQGISFYQSYFFSSNFEDVNFSNSSFVNTSISVTKGVRDLSKMTNVNFSNAKIHSYTLDGKEVDELIGYEITNCNFENVEIEGIKIQENFFKDCNLTNAKIRNSSVKHVGIKNSNLSSSSFENSKIDGVGFSSCILANAVFRMTEMIYAGFDDSDLTGAVFHTRVFRNITFTRTNLTRAILPPFGTDQHITFVDVTGRSQQTFNNLTQIAMEVHNKSMNTMSKIDTLVEILKEDLENVNVNIYKNTKKYLTDKIGTHINTSPEFNRNRSKWKDDFKKTLKVLQDFEEEGGPIHDKQREMIGIITDFVFKQNLQECFIQSLVYDCTHAYNIGTPGHENGMSCFRGIVERFPGSLQNCIVDKSGGVFDELKAFFNIETAKTWKNLNKGIQNMFIAFWNKHLQQWIQSKVENANTVAMNANTRKQALLDYVKQKFREEHNGNELPKEVEDFYKSEYLNTLDWGLFGFDGGSRRRGRQTRRKVKKVKKTRKH